MPYICLNMGTGTLEEALAWVEYSNWAGRTYWVDRCRSNGRAEPSQVTYWSLATRCTATGRSARSAPRSTYARRPGGPGRSGCSTRRPSWSADRRVCDYAIRSSPISACSNEIRSPGKLVVRAIAVTG